jgi:deoxyadenosine/deoxycytidine kinase
MERIRSRDRAFERPLREEYLGALGGAYEEFFASFAGPAHVTVDVARLDWEGRPEDYAEVREIVTRTVANLDAGQGTFEFAEAGGAGPQPKRAGAAGGG